MLSIAKIAIACLHTIPESGQNNVASFLRTFNSEATFGKYSTNNHIRRISWSWRIDSLIAWFVGAPLFCLCIIAAIFFHIYSLLVNHLINLLLNCIWLVRSYSSKSRVESFANKTKCYICMLSKYNQICDLELFLGWIYWSWNDSIGINLVNKRMADL